MAHLYAETTYHARKPDAKGYVAYTAEDEQIWKDLYTRQIKIIQNRACDEFLEGLDILKMSEDHIPQIPDINKPLMQATGWSVYPVAALINFDKFFKLLANRQFPAATFIRTREDFDYIREPDIFHEFFGHCPMLTQHAYADFMQKYGEVGVNATHAERVMLARLYWFTVEFGLIQTEKGARIYGGGILSSKSETIYALEDPRPERKPFVPLEALRTPYRIDILQTVYFVLENYQQLFDLVQADLLQLIVQAKQLGEYPPTYPSNTV